MRIVSYYYSLDSEQTFTTCKWLVKRADGMFGIDDSFISIVHVDVENRFNAAIRLRFLLNNGSAKMTEFVASHFAQHRRRSDDSVGG